MFVILGDNNSHKTTNVSYVVFAIPYKRTKIHLNAAVKIKPNYIIDTAGSI